MGVELFTRKVALRGHGKEPEVSPPPPVFLLFFPLRSSCNPLNAKTDAFILALKVEVRGYLLQILFQCASQGYISYSQCASLSSLCLHSKSSVLNARLCVSVSQNVCAYQSHGPLIMLHSWSTCAIVPHFQDQSKKVLRM